MAEVFEAKDELLQRSVALKLMHPQFARDPTFINRFRREAQAAASLNDPRVVAIYDWGADDGAYYIVMEYVEGATLREIVETQGPLTAERSVEVAADICGGLALAHSKGLVHRDIKSSNIAVTTTGQTKIMDFGIARAASGADTATQTGTVIGTANYFSPEQAQGLSVDHRSDLYSVGVLLYEMLTREMPFKADTALAIAYKHVQEDPVPPSRLNPDIPPALDAVVMKCLAKNPDNRYQTAEEMRADLQRLLKGEQVEATPILAPDQTMYVDSPGATSVLPAALPPAGSRRRKTLAYVLAFALVASILALAGLFLFSLVDKAGPQIVVPDVSHKPLEEAQRLLSAQGLVGSVERSDFSDSFPEGTVISQQPEQGIKTAKGTRVGLIVSKGAQTVEVPSVIGKSRSDASAALAQAGLQLGNVSDRPDDNVAAGKVLEQDPGAGQKVDRGGSVDVVLSKGQSLIRVPDVTGQTAESARAKLADAGLKSSVTTVCDQAQPNNSVIKQDPGARQEVAKGTSVALSVNGAKSVPGVVGQTQERAVRNLQEAGFTADVIAIPAIDGTGKVTQQDPQPGPADCNSNKVLITVSKPLLGTP